MNAIQPAALHPACEPIDHDRPRIAEVVPETTTKDQPHDTLDPVSTRVARLLAAYEYTALSH